jgi:uncharacterized protein (DUF362 family)
MSATVAIVTFEEKANIGESFDEALRLIGGIDELNVSERSVVVKVGVYSHKAENHSSVDVVRAITESFYNAPEIFLVESDNYQGTGSERLKIWQELFSERIAPFNLSEDANAQSVVLAGQKMELSPILFKPNVIVDTHILRTYARGSILKNLFGCIPDPKKAKFHKNTILFPLLADIYEAIGGIDLAVLDGTYLWRGGSNLGEPANILVVGRDAVAVETVGAYLGGLKPREMPVLQEFTKRGLGEGDLDQIEIVGMPLEPLKEMLRAATRALEKKWERYRKAQKGKGWSPTIDRLIQEGFFNLPNKRTRADVEKALRDRGIATEGRSSVIYTTLTRKVKKGKLRGAKGPEGWSYWAE